MVRIRLTRIGSKKNAIYRMVVIDSRSPRDSRSLEILGYYNPHANPASVQLQPDRIISWLQRGAQPSDTVRSLLKKQGILKKKQENTAA